MASFHPVSSKRCKFMSRFFFGGVRNTLTDGEVSQNRRRSAVRGFKCYLRATLGRTYLSEDAGGRVPRDLAPYNLRPINMVLRIVRLGSARAPGEGTRIGTVRRPPRGVPKARFATDHWYDVWLPELSPSAELVKRALAAQSDTSAAGEREWAAFTRGYRTEMARPAAAHAIALLAALSRTGDFSVGCYCENEARCHRAVLRALLAEAGAEIVPAQA